MSLLIVGFMCLYQKKYRAAIEYFDLVLATDPENIFALTGKGVALEDTGQYTRALICYHQVLFSDPHNDLVWNLIGQTYIKLNQYPEALNACTISLKHNPNSSLALFNKGISLYLLQRYRFAIECFDDILMQNPKDIDALTNKAAALCELKNYKEGLKCCNYALELDPRNNKVWFTKAFLWEQVENYQESIKCLKEIVKTDPENFRARFFLGKYYFILGRLPESVACLDYALSINPDDEQALIYKMITEEELRKTRPKDLLAKQEKSMIEFLIGCMKHHSENVRSNAVSILSDSDNPIVIPYLIESFGDNSSLVTDTSYKLIRKFGFAAYYHLNCALNHTSKSVRLTSALLSGEWGNISAIQTLILALDDESEDIRSWAENVCNYLKGLMKVNFVKENMIAKYTNRTPNDSSLLSYTLLNEALNKSVRIR